MKKINKLLALFMALVMVFSLAACNKEEGNEDDTTNKSVTSTDTGAKTETKTDDGAKTDTPAKTDAPAAEPQNYNISVWVPELAVDLTMKQIADFNKTNDMNITFNATVEAVSESEAATTMITDVESGADIFFFAQDQTARLIQAGALSKLGVKAGETVTATNASGSVSAAKSGDDLYAYPLTADNGYFLYYDNTIVAPEHAASLEDIIADCEKAGASLCFETKTSAWYLAGFFFGTGCKSEWITDDDGTFVSVSDNFNSDAGLIAAKAVKMMLNSKSYVSSSSGQEFASAIPAGAVVSGTWDYEVVKEILGDKMGTAELPYFTVDGNKYHIGSYSGCKLLGVKPQVDAAKSAAIHKLAQYLTSEEAQLERFNALSWGPANLVDQASAEVQANPGLAALAAQSSYAIPQGQIHGTWWDIGKVIASDIEESDGSDEALKGCLQKYEDSIAALFNMSTDVKEAFTVIGAICGTAWDSDFDMVRSAETGAQMWYSKDALALKAGDEFQVRQGLSWDVQFGAVDAATGLSTKDNFKVEEDGTYYVCLSFDADSKTGTVSLVKNSYATGWTVIGTLADTNWDADFDMAVQDDGTTYVSVDSFALTAGTEFKVRQGHGWDVSFGDGGNNYVVAEDTECYISFDSVSGTITLIAK